MAAVTITAASIVPVTGFSSEHSYVAGATITRGLAVYLDTVTNTWKLADSDLSAAAAGSLGLVGISLSDVVATQPMIVFIGGHLGMGVCLTQGKVYCVGQVAGEIIAHAELTSTAKVTILGVATSTSNLYCRPWYTGAAIP
jgi:hypothetical protein